MLTDFQEVMIDGKPFIPRDTVISDECMRALRELYGMIWTEAHYDPYNEQTQKFAERLHPHIRLLNDRLHFKK